MQVFLKRDGSTGTLNKARGFIEQERRSAAYRDPLVRLKDWEELNDVDDPLNRKVQG
jgi:hypothetical protein